MRIQPVPLVARGTYTLAEQATCLATAPVGGLIAAGSYEEDIELLDLDMNLIGKLEGHPGGSTALAFAAGGQLLVSAGEDGCAAVWRCDGRTLKARLACEGVDADRWVQRRLAALFSGRGGRLPLLACGGFDLGVAGVHAGERPRLQTSRKAAWACQVAET
jgi:hypothetical protein